MSDLTLIFVDMSLYTIEIKYGTNQVSRVEFCSWVIYTENFKYQISNPYEDIVITRNCFEIDHTFCRLISTNKCLSSKFQVSTPHNSEDTSITRIFFSGTYRRTDGSEKKSYMHPVQPKSKPFYQISSLRVIPFWRHRLNKKLFCVNVLKNRRIDERRDGSALKVWCFLFALLLTSSPSFRVWAM